MQSILKFSTLLYIALIVLGIIALIVEHDPTVWRNAYQAMPSNVKDFLWKPDQIPSDYKKNTHHVSKLLISFTKDIKPASGIDFWFALPLALYVKNLDGQEIQSTTDDILNQLTQYGHGYCADITQLITGIGLATGMPVRRWGMGFGSYGTDGHAFTEVWSEILNKWVFVDYFNGFYMLDARNMKLLSVLELNNILNSCTFECASKRIIIVHLSDKYSAFKTDLDAIKYYYRGKDRFYMLWGDNVFDYDESGPVQAGAKIGRIPEQIIAIMLGIQPGIKLLPTDNNHEDIYNILLMGFALKCYLLVISVLSIFVMIIILLQVKVNR